MEICRQIVERVCPEGSEGQWIKKCEQSREIRADNVSFHIIVEVPNFANPSSELFQAEETEDIWEKLFEMTAGPVRRLFENGANNNHIEDEDEGKVATRKEIPTTRLTPIMMEEVMVLNDRELLQGDNRGREALSTSPTAVTTTTASTAEVVAIVTSQNFIEREGQQSSDGPGTSTRRSDDPTSTVFFDPRFNLVTSSSEYFKETQRTTIVSDTDNSIETDTPTEVKDRDQGSENSLSLRPEDTVLKEATPTQTTTTSTTTTSTTTTPTTTT
eukprot:maker-scaffold532_size145644-snap-gene-0.46 protein:Tk04534 transcript:maker-scaffold532_size145644-snap-gene-0.46-mRNA-1 annotation:"---NA---"